MLDPTAKRNGTRKTRKQYTNELITIFKDIARLYSPTLYGLICHLSQTDSVTKLTFSLSPRFELQSLGPCNREPYAITTYLQFRTLGCA